MKESSTTRRPGAPTGRPPRCPALRISLISLLLLSSPAEVKCLRSDTVRACREAPPGALAFESKRGGDTDVYVMEADGTDVRRVTRGGTPEAEPSWSPDGRWLVYQSQRPYWKLFVAREDGSEERALTTSLSWSPSWSPTGEWIASGGQVGIRMIRQGGGEVVTLATGGGYGRPSWSPDGAELLYHASAEGGPDIYRRNLASGETMRLTDSPGRDFQAVWSPDGRLIAFSSERDGDLEIFVMSATGSDVVQLTDNESGDMMPAWSPDGRWLAFVSDRDGDEEIYVMRADGTCQARVTHNPGPDRFPAWRPTPARSSGG